MKVDVVCLGELLIDFVSLTRNVSLIDSEAFKKAPGGAPANVAAGLARLGLSAGFIGKVGDDPFGFYLKKVLDDIGVDTSCLAFDRDARTTLALISEKSDGVKDAMFYRNPGADMLLSEDEISEAYIAGAKVFHFGSISLGSPVCKKATLKAIEYAKKYGLLISYDPNLRLSLWNDAGSAKKEIDAGFAYADVVKISDEEYEFITGCRTVEDCAVYILGKGPRLVLVTLGSKGCYYSDGRSSGYLPGFNVKVAETTGAGDAFVAAVLFNLMKRIDKQTDAYIDKQIEMRSDKCKNGSAQGQDDKYSGVLTVDDGLVDALVFANAAGALATTKMGAIPSLPAFKDVNEFIGR